MSAPQVRLQETPTVVIEPAVVETAQQRSTLPFRTGGFGQDVPEYSSEDPTSVAEKEFGLFQEQAREAGLLAKQQEEMASRASMEVKNPALNTNIDNPPTSLPQSEGGLMESFGMYSRGALPFIGLSLAGGVISTLGKDAVDYFLRKDNSFERGYKYEPVIVNQIGLDVENTQRITTSRAQRRKKRH